MRTTHNQTLMDVAIMATGTLESLFDIATLNDMSITDIPAVDTEILIPNNAPIDRATLQYLKNEKVQMGTLPEAPRGGGIGYMQMGYDFVVVG